MKLMERERETKNNLKNQLFFRPGPIKWLKFKRSYLNEHYYHIV